MDIFSLPPLSPVEILVGLVIAIIVVWLGMRSARKAERRRQDKTPTAP